MLGVVGLGIASLSLLLEVIGLAIPYWLNGNTAENTGYLGLWKVCYFVGPTSICKDTSSSSLADMQGIMASLQATRAMEIMAMLAMSGTVACFVLKLFVMKQQNLLPKIGAAVAIIGGTMAIIGCVIFAAKFKKERFFEHGFELHAGFALCLVAAVGAYVSAVLSILGGRQD